MTTVPQVRHHVAGATPIPASEVMPDTALHGFIKAWSGKRLEGDDDSHSGMELVRAYNREVVGAPPFWGRPIDLLATYSADDYVWIQETAYRSPAPGDVIVWGPRPQDASDCGHVAIFVKGDARGFDSFEAVGSMPSLQHHADYRDVVGWLHPIGVPVWSAP